MRRKSIAGAILIAVGCLIALGFGTGFGVDWLWFSAIGYLPVFRTILVTKLALFAAVFVVSALWLWASGMLALRFARRASPWFPARLGLTTGSAQGLPDLLKLMSYHRIWRWGVTGVALGLAFLIATGEIGSWNLVLQFLHQLPYGRRDPLFGKDIGFYLFSLPAYLALTNWMMTTLVLSAIVAGIVYWARGDISLGNQRWRLSTAALAHACALLGIFFAVKAWSYGLDRFLLLYDNNGVVVGADYTDVHIELPVLWTLIGFASGAAILCWINMWWRKVWLPAVVVAAFVVMAVVTVGLPSLFERVYVKPNELTLEAPYLRRNIALTREAYGLSRVVVRSFPADQGLTLSSLEADSGTINNIRLWDWQPLMDTYAQLQEIRTYYKFHDVDVDRYEIGKSYQQVMVSARELESTLLPSNAQTWVNLHLIFTHGNGVVMSPVTQKTAEGLPRFYEKDVPPVASGGPVVRQPRIYFGEGNSPYVIVKTKTPEFDYPKGADNVYTTYAGNGGVGIGGFARRSLFSWYFGDLNILVSNYISGDSRILIHRNIQDRVRAIAPFLRLDHDPYIVISDGRLFWIQDAYTTSPWFPYSQPAPGGTINYIRNSVKIVIDAYSGAVDFYVADPTDPILATYRRIFPGLFKPFAAMPPDLQRHVRYPEDLFTIQAELYRAYHMTAPEVFYNREDLWQFPRQTSGVGGNDAAAQGYMAPYYMIMRLPEEKRAAFFLMLPMVPSQRENMIAWLAAGCDAQDYGKLVVYEFPKEKLVYGPFQIEARINQNTEISQQISLWNQMGSRVIRGNILVIPVGNSILYVSPLYLRAASGQLPELKRVIAVYDDRVVMEKSLPQALAALFASPTASSSAATAMVQPPAAAGSMTGEARDALEVYNRAIGRLKAGDWSGFGTQLDSLRQLLEKLGGRPSGP